MAYDVSNPHPMYGKDPNIINEFGHTAYPKWIDTGKKDDKGKPVRVLVENKKEEEKIVGKEGWNR